VLAGGAFRLSVDPTDRWALQVSYARIHSPEQLEPDVNQDRDTTASVPLFVHAALR
jgi:hypothetical protein